MITCGKDGWKVSKGKEILGARSGQCSLAWVKSVCSSHSCYLKVRKLMIPAIGDRYYL